MRPDRTAQRRSGARTLAELCLQSTHTLPTVPVQGDEVESPAGHPTEQSWSQELIFQGSVCRLFLGITNT